MPSLVPVEFDPFTESKNQPSGGSTTGGGRLVPVNFDPFSEQSQQQGGIGAALVAGAKESSTAALLSSIGIGKYLAGQQYQPKGFVERTAKGVAELAGDIPAMVAGALPGALTGPAAPVTSLAGAFALPEAIKAWKRGESAGQIAKAAGTQAVIGGLTGAAGKFVTPLARGLGIGQRAAEALRLPAEIGTLTTASAAAQGRAPTVEDFVTNGAILFGGKLAMHGAARLIDHYHATGETPEAAAQRVQAAAQADNITPQQAADQLLRLPAPQSRQALAGPPQRLGLPAPEGVVAGEGFVMRPPAPETFLRNVPGATPEEVAAYQANRGQVNVGRYDFGQTPAPESAVPQVAMPPVQPAEVSPVAPTMPEVAPVRPQPEVPAEPIVANQILGRKIQSPVIQTPGTSRTYEQVQAKIDAIETILEQQGRDVVKMFDPAGGAKASDYPPGYTPMPEPLAKLYRERWAIEKADTNQFIDKVVSDSGLTTKEATSALDSIYFKKEQPAYFTQRNINEWGQSVTDNLSNIYNRLRGEDAPMVKFYFGGTADSPRLLLKNVVGSEDLPPDRNILAKTERLYNAVAKNIGQSEINLTGKKIERATIAAAPVSEVKPTDLLGLEFKNPEVEKTRATQPELFKPEMPNAPLPSGEPPPSLTEPGSLFEEGGAGSQARAEAEFQKKQAPLPLPDTGIEPPQMYPKIYKDYESATGEPTLARMIYEQGGIKTPKAEKGTIREEVLTNIPKTIRPFVLRTDGKSVDELISEIQARGRPEIQSESDLLGALDLEHTNIENIARMNRQAEASGGTGYFGSGLGGLQGSYEALAKFTKEKAADAMPHLENIGRSLYQAGMKFSEFTSAMKGAIGEHWDKFKSMMLNVYRAVKQWNAKLGETGAINLQKAKEATEGVTAPAREAGQGLKGLVLPTSKSPEHVQAAEVMAHQLIGTPERSIQGARAALTPARNYFNRLLGQGEAGRQQAINFMEAIDKGRPLDSPFARPIKNLLAKNRASIGEVSPEKAQWLSEDYFPRIVEQDQVPALMNYLSKRPLGGSKGFLKHRSSLFGEIADLEQAGFKLKSYNPIDLLEEHNVSVQRYLGWERAKQEFVNRGDIINVNNSGVPLSKNLRATIGKIPYNSEHWAKIDDRFGTIWRQNPETHLPERIGFRVAKRPVAEIINNYLSRGLSTNEHVGFLYRTYMGVANSLNQAQLGLGSAFHAGFTTAETFFSGMANNMKDMYRLAIGKGSVGDVAKGLVETIKAPVENPVVKGNQILNEYMKPGSTTNPDIVMVAKAVEIAGGRAHLEYPLRTHQYEAMLKDWYQGHHAKAALRSPVAFTELTAMPIMRWLVPRQKMAVFSELVKRIVQNNPGRSLESLRPELRQAWNRVDARLGQVVYDRLFLQNTAKQAVQGLIRAPGWSGGTLAEVGGSFKDAANFVKEWARTGKPPEQLPDRVAYTLSLLVGAAAINGALTYLFTGEKPKDMDYWAFRTGDTDQRGRPERFVLPTYAKDIFAYYENPTKTILAKTHPLISVMSDVLIRNKDYYGVEIRHPGDAPIQQASDLAKYGIHQFIPFWIRGESRIAGDLGGLARAIREHPGRLLAPEFGVMPASAEYTNTPAEKKINEIYQRRPMFAKTREEYEKQQLKYQMLKRIKEKDPTVMADMLQAIKDGKLTYNDRRELLRNQRFSPLRLGLRNLSVEQAMEVWNAASEQERRDIVRDIRQKITRNQSLNGRQKHQLLMVLNQGGQFEMGLPK